MAINDTDIEILDTYLDGELPAEQCESLWRRMAEDSDLAIELERCRSDRAIRAKVFASMEPAELSVKRTQTIVSSAKRRTDFTSILTRSFNGIAAAAACILFGFAVGWMGHNKYPASVPAGATPASFINTQQTKPIPTVKITDDQGRVVFTKQFATAEEASRFVDDFNKSRTSHREVHDSPVVPAMDQEQF